MIFSWNFTVHSIAESCQGLELWKILYRGHLTKHITMNRLVQVTINMPNIFMKFQFQSFCKQVISLTTKPPNLVKVRVNACSTDPTLSVTEGDTWGHDVTWIVMRNPPTTNNVERLELIQLTQCLYLVSWFYFGGQQAQWLAWWTPGPQQGTCHGF